MDAEQLERYRERLETDTPYYARHCLKIIDQRGKKVPLVGKPAQLRFDAELEKQRAAGRPMRGIILKARKLGFSTWVAGKATQRYTTIPNHKALVVAHDKKTAGQLFEISETMYGNLPDEEIAGMALKPPVAASRRQAEITLGEPSRAARRAGDRGINSSLTVDTAAEFEAGRGFTYSTLHLSEVAFWPSIVKKSTSLLNTVPDEPNTLIVLESTANGYNHFRKRFYDALNGTDSDYFAFFSPWFEEPEYVRPFLNEEDRAAFMAKIGTGEYGDDEPELIAEHGCTPEQLAWRRWAIANRCEGDLRVFHQEYPATPEEAFLSTGKQVFAPSLVAGMVRDAEQAPPPVRAALEPESWDVRQMRGGDLRVPSKEVLWTPQSEVTNPIGRAWWDFWEPPDPGEEVAGERRHPGQYIVGVDAASGNDTETGDEAYMAIEVVNHRTGMQVAEHRSRLDPDQIALQCWLAARYYNNAWLAIEITGGWGGPIARKLWRDWHYPMIYFRKRLDSTKTERQQDLLGWNTSVQTKPMIVAHFKELLRTGNHGVRSRGLASEFPTYVKDDRGRMGPESDYFADRLMAYLIAKFVAAEKPLRTFRPATSTSTRPVRSTVGGY